MKIEYTVTPWTEVGHGIKDSDLLEGHVKISHAGTTILDEQGVLVVGLAACFYEWLTRDSSVQFIEYESGYFEESPVLRISEQGSEVRLTSALREGKILQVLEDEFRQGIREYFQRLATDIEMMFGTSLEKRLESRLREKLEFDAARIAARKKPDYPH